MIKNLRALTLSVTLALFPLVSSAQTGFTATGGQFGQLLRDLLTFTNNVLIPFVIGIGFLFFVWGMFQYFIAGGANDESKEKGKSLMIYATLGFVLIIIFWGIVNLLAGSSGFDGGVAPTVPNTVTPAAGGTIGPVLPVGGS